MNSKSCSITSAQSVGQFKTDYSIPCYSHYNIYSQNRVPSDFELWKLHAY